MGLGFYSQIPESDVRARSTPDCVAYKWFLARFSTSPVTAFTRTLRLLRAEENWVGFDELQGFHHVRRFGLVFFEVWSLQMRLVRGAVCIRLEDSNLCRMVFHRHRTQREYARLDP